MVHLSRPLSFDEYALIIEHVNADRELRPALKNLCLAQRSFVPLCQKHIFSSIICSPKKVDVLPDIAGSSPHLFDHIRSLNYKLDDSNQPDSVKTRRNESAVQLFKRIHDLHDLSISDLNFRGVHWKAIDPQVCNALLRLIRSPTLRSISLSNIRKFPPNGLLGLRKCQHLEAISITSIEVEGADAAQLKNVTTSDSGSPPIPQPSSFISGAGSANAVLTLLGGPSGNSPLNRAPVFDFTGLRSIYAGIDGYSDALANYALIRQASRLEDLTFAYEQAILDDLCNVKFFYRKKTVSSKVARAITQDRYGNSGQR